MFIVLEMQTTGVGELSVLSPIVRASREEAESAYHAILSCAAVSSVPLHAAVLMTNEGVVLERKSYVHETPAAL